MAKNREEKGEMIMVEGEGIEKQSERIMRHRLTIAGCLYCCLHLLFYYLCFMVEITPILSSFLMALHDIYYTVNIAGV